VKTTAFSTAARVTAIAIAAMGVGFKIMVAVPTRGDMVEPIVSTGVVVSWQSVAP